MSTVVSQQASHLELVVKNSLASAGRHETWIQSLGQKDLLNEGMATTPVLLPRESHGQRSLAGYSSEGHKELDMRTELN